MVRLAKLVAGSVLLAGAGGCTFLVDLLNPPITTVRLVNSSDFAVRIVLYYDEEQDLPRDALTEVGTRMEITLQAKTETSFSRDCDELQSVVIDNAELVLIDPIGPEAGSEVERDGDDFGCRDTIVFTFDHSPLILDFAVTTSFIKASSGS